MIDRRAFMRDCALCGIAAAMCPAAVGMARAKDARDLAAAELREAMFWEPAGDGKVRCTTCPNLCVRAEGEVTFCNTRVNRGGKLYTAAYGNPCLLNVDPIQKNPLFHVDPGASAVGVATAGCNLRCTYCQNWDISQVGPWSTRNLSVSPSELVAKTREKKLGWITFSYTEPTAYFEYALDTAKLAKAAGLRVAVVSAGMISAAPLAELVKHSDAFSVTIKGATKEFYREVCAANLDDVWRTVASLSRAKRWVEIVTLIVPGVNDTDDGFKMIAGGIARLDKNIPLHFLRFAPAYKLKHLAPTPVQTMERAREIALAEGLRFVYLDLSGHNASHTFCPQCKTMMIERVGFSVLNNHLKAGRCAKCGYRLPGLFPCA